LVPHVPNELIVRRIKDIVKGYGELYDTQTGTKMTAFCGYHIYNKIPKLIANLRELSFLDFIAKIFRKFDLIQ